MHEGLIKGEMLDKRIQDNWEVHKYNRCNAGLEGCRTGGRQNKRDAGLEGCRTGRMQEWRDGGKEGFMKGAM